MKKNKEPIETYKFFLFILFGFTLGFAVAYLSPTLATPSIKTLNSLSDVSSILIALCALYFTYYQLRETKIASRINQTPHLMLSSTLHPSDYKYKLTIHNYGNGPALIRSMSVYFKNNIYNDYPNKNLRALIHALDRSNAVSYVSGCDLNSTVVIAPGRDFELASLNYDHTQISDYNSFNEQFHTDLKDIKIIVEFETTFGKLDTFEDGIV